MGRSRFCLTATRAPWACWATGPWTGGSSIGWAEVSLTAPSALVVLPNSRGGFFCDYFRCEKVWPGSVATTLKDRCMSKTLGCDVVRSRIHKLVAMLEHRCVFRL